LKIDARAAEADGNHGNLKPFVMLQGLRKLRFYRYMKRKTTMFAFPSAIRTDGYRIDAFR
jgi:hypothetical protein